MKDVEVMRVVRTNLKLVGDGEDEAYHRHEQFWTFDGELLAENCEPGWCDD